MHESSFNTIKDFIQKFDVNEKLVILDVGSRAIEDDDVTFRSLMSENWRYIGVDVVAGKNVDMVAFDPYRYGIAGDAIDVIITGSCLEHVPEPWRLIEEFYRILRPGGEICITAPSVGKIHCLPDFYRFKPDGMKYLLERAGFKNVTAYLNDNPKWLDCVGVAKK
jgi:SAM-dependent methyltransferase